MPLQTRSQGRLQASLFDVNGRLVRTLTGKDMLTWNGTDSEGRLVTAGVYFVDVRQGSEKLPAKVLFLRD